MANGYLVERRSGRDRRMVSDRRLGSERRAGDERRQSADHESVAAARGLISGGESFIDATTGAPYELAPMGSKSTLARSLLDGVGAVLVDIVGGFYEAGTDAKAWPQVLSRLRDLVDADVCAIASHEHDAGRGRLEHSVGIDALYVTAYADFYARDNVWLRDQEKFTTADTVWASQDLLPDARLVETEFYKFWLRPQELFHHLFGVINVEGDRVLFLMLGRARAKGAFWQDDADLIRRLLPALRRGLSAGVGFKRLQSLHRIALDTLDALPIGVFLLNDGGQIVVANRLAREILQDDEGLYVSTSGLGVRLTGGRVKVRDLILGGPSRAGERAGEIQGFSLPRGPGRKPVTLLLSPVQDFSEARNRSDPAAVLFAADPERPVEVDPRRLTRIYGLSRAEARVAALLATGKRLHEVAAALGLTYETVRKHLKQIFSKTSSERQADLVRTLSLGPGGLRI